MNKDELDILVWEELAELENMKQMLEDRYNSIENIERRRRISDHIGREWLDC